MINLLAFEQLANFIITPIHSLDERLFHKLLPPILPLPIRKEVSMPASNLDLLQFRPALRKATLTLPSLYTMKRARVLTIQSYKCCEISDLYAQSCGVFNLLSLGEGED